MAVTCYPSPGKKKGLKICEHFARGCGGRVAPVTQTELSPGPAFFYGWTEHTARLLKQCQRDGRDWYYADNAYYFGRGEYFRVTKNRLMHDGKGAHGPERFEPFGITIKPYRKAGAHVILTTQSEAFYRDRLGVARDRWTEQVINELKLYTDREVIVCHKPDPRESGNAYAAPGFERYLADCWAVVSLSSSTMVKALIEGIPVFSIGASMASCMGYASLSLIEKPLYPEGREQWLWNLAANQWTYGELADGTCWRALEDQA